ncbi:hypothetical protein [Devosia sp. Root105]|uniref:hypothetical protein n=1 Tax=Devosia sp. Root105 TaxID=1736423 RepID=UPI000ABF3CE7|nr:hypothetical protein [Devosia sp. Root105]
MFRSFMLGVSALALVSVAEAADLFIETAYEAPVVESYGLRGVVELGGLGRMAQEDGGDFSSFGGVYGAFAIEGQYDALVLGLDGYGEWLAIEDSDPNVTNGNLGVLGAQVGMRMDNWYLGGFGTLATYPDAETVDQFVGYAAGVQAAVDIDHAQLVGRLGYAFAPNDDFDNDDEGFVGPFAEIGAAYALSSDFAVMANVGYGFSANFDVSNDPGEYVNWGVKAAYRLPGDLNLNLVASYEGLHAFDQDDESNTTHTVKLGISIPFGDEGTAMEALRPLASPTAPFRASVSADVL